MLLGVVVGEPFAPIDCGVTEVWLGFVGRSDSRCCSNECSDNVPRTRPAALLVKSNFAKACYACLLLPILEVL